MASTLICSEYPTSEKTSPSSNQSSAIKKNLQSSASAAKLLAKPEIEKPNSENQPLNKSGPENTHLENSHLIKSESVKRHRKKPDLENPRLIKSDSKKWQPKKPDLENPNLIKPETERPLLKKPDLEKLHLDKSEMEIIPTMEKPECPGEGEEGEEGEVDEGEGKGEEGMDENGLRMVGGREMTFRPILFSGPSGTGKSTLVQRLMKEFRDCFSLSVSHTTRKPRAGEQNGREYYFVSRQQMETMIANDEFIEFTEFAGNLYGTSKNAIKDIASASRTCLLLVDLNGIKYLKTTDLNPRCIFVRPPNLQALEDRLRGRYTETEESVANRLECAKAEMEYAAITGNYDHVIINNNLDASYEMLKQLLIMDIASMMQKRLSIQSHA